MRALVCVVVLGVDEKLDATPRTRHELVADAGEVAGHQCKKVARLGKGVVPLGPVTTVLERAAVHQIAVAQKHRVALLGGHQRDREYREHVGTIEVVGDLAKTFGLALGAEVAARAIQAFETGVVLGTQLIFHLQHEPLGNAENAQAFRSRAVLPGCQSPAVEGKRAQLDVLAVQLQRPRGAAGATAHSKARTHVRALFAELNAKIDVLDQKVRRTIVLEMDRPRRLGERFVSHHDRDHRVAVHWGHQSERRAPPLRQRPLGAPMVEKGLQPAGHGGVEACAVGKLA